MAVRLPERYYDMENMLQKFKKEIDTFIL
jgi:hypothetical protein